MAQYVFWTGDEEGVAKAVEEFIQKGMVSLLCCGFDVFRRKKNIDYGVSEAL